MTECVLVIVPTTLMQVKLRQVNITDHVEEKTAVRSYIYSLRILFTQP